MARDVVIDVVTRHDSRGLSEAADGLDKVATKADNLDGSMGDLTDTSSELEIQIRQTKKAIADLGEEFDRTGDRTLFGEMRKQQSLLRDLERMAKAAAAAAPAAAESGEAIGKAVVGGATRGTIRGGPALVAALSGVVIAAAPGIGAMLAGAVAGAVGTVGVAAGLASAAKDTQVQAEARALGRAISSEFFSGGAAFREPAIMAIRELKDAFSDMEIPDALAKMAPLVDEIARGFGDAGRRFMPGFNRALDRMGPFAAVAEDGIAGLGDALGDFADLTTQSEGALTGLELLFRIVNGSIRLLGASLKVASDITDTFATANVRAFSTLHGLARGLGFHQLAEGALKMADVWLRVGQDMPDKKLTKLGEAIDSTTGATWRAIPAFEEVEEKIRRVNDAVTDSISTALALDNANLGLQQSMLDLSESIKENGRHWETNTEAGLANRRALLDAVAAAERKRQADIDSGKSADAANAAFQRTIDRLKEIARRAGISEDALRDLIGDYNIDIHVKVHGKVPHLKYRNNYLEGEVFPRRTFATGGVTPAFEPFRVHDGETLWSSREHFVATKAQTQALTNVTAGGGTSQVTVMVSGSRFVQMAADELIREFGRRGLVLVSRGSA